MPKKKALSKFEVPRKKKEYRCRNRECKAEFNMQRTPQRAAIVQCPECGSTAVEII